MPEKKEVTVEFDEATNKWISKIKDSTKAKKKEYQASDMPMAEKSMNIVQQRHKMLSDI